MTEEAKKDKIDVSAFFDALPTYRERPENFVKDWKDIIRSPAARAALAMLEESALLLEKNFLGIDFTLPDGAMRGLELSAQIRGIRFSIDKLVEIANGDE